MKIAKAMRQAAQTTARILAVLFSAFLLIGPVQFCLCDSDPDNCGHECHDCAAPQSDECTHLALDLEEFTLPSKDPLPVLPLFTPPRYDFCTLAALDTRIAPRPKAASPPTRRGQYLSYSTRTNPLS